MKSTTLKKLKDNQKFQLGNRKLSAVYRLVRVNKKEKTATYNSIESNRSFMSDWNRKCFV